MIDLRKKGLPNAIMVNGNSFLINTDFRKWIKVSKMLEEKCTIIDLAEEVIQSISLAELLENSEEILSKLLEFYTNPNATPRVDSNDTTPIIDYVEDGEYIVGSFMQAYGIDLTICDMHWHLFKALLLSLPENSKMKQIMQMRSYKKSNISYEKQQENLKKAWELHKKENNEISDIMLEINNEFYNS